MIPTLGYWVGFSLVPQKLGRLDLQGTHGDRANEPTKLYFRKKKSRNCEVVAEDWKARPLQKIRKALLRALEDRLPERV